MQKKNLAQPDEARSFDKGLLELVTLGGVTFGRGTFQPGWRWSTSVKPLAKTASCEAPHLQYRVAGARPGAGAAVKRLVKRLVFGGGARPRRVLFGVAAGCTFVIDPAHKSQRIVGLDEAELGPVFARAVARCRTVIDVGASDGY